MERNEALSLTVVKAMQNMRARCHISITSLPMKGLID
jgi:hypothetical protein